MLGNQRGSRRTEYQERYVALDRSQNARQSRNNLEHRKHHGPSGYDNHKSLHDADGPRRAHSYSGVERRRGDGPSGPEDFQRVDAGLEHHSRDEYRRREDFFGSQHRREDLFGTDHRRRGGAVAVDNGASHAKQFSSGLVMEPLANLSGNPYPHSEAEFRSAPSKNRRVKDNFVNRVVDQCSGAIVRVETEQKVLMPAAGDADIFSFFFGVRPEGGKQERKVHGHGSGFCIDGPGGVVLTNAHVVQGADRVSISFGDGKASLECEVLETDEVIDLAAIRVKERLKNPLPSVRLGSSESLKTGDWAIVLGNPFGLQNTCTLGIISSLDRSTGETGFDWMRHPLLQTDAAVNQGNSGGPLLNEVGEVVGMISMRALFGEGIGFATPADSIAATLPSLLRGKKVSRGYVGLKMTAESPDGERRHGAFVEVVLPKSPAEAAGLQAEDQIIEAQRQKVKHFADVQRLVRSSKPGGELNFKVKRGNQTHSLRVVVEDIKNLRKELPQRSGRSAPNGGQHRIIMIPRSK